MHDKRQPRAEGELQVAQDSIITASTPREMQVNILVQCAGGPSLREKINKDDRLEEFGLTVKNQKKIGRRNGWSKLHSHPHDKYGSLNLHWDPNSSVLICRSITKGRNSPGPLVGAFVGYLMKRHWRQIMSIAVVG